MYELILTKLFDFSVLSGSVDTPIPFLSVGVEYFQTAYGDVFASPQGSLGVSSPVSGGYGFGNIISGPGNIDIAPGTATRDQINNVLRGRSGGLGVGAGPGFEMFKNSSGVALVKGEFAFNASFNASVGIRLPINVCGN